ncbi:unnamed protein product [Ceratitis capitata]|uniref:(Mediterranean fruit fly) hypothetical protein n=1 Tax=Ceratitis capitata TaxID=7213 RepID=A0A811US85_CERCA|nr:unnamed protein product [Ceratitis capitata]
MHLEHVGDLSAAALLSAFERFMHSDNGSNFVGAEKILRSNIQQFMADDPLQSLFTTSSIEWLLTKGDLFSREDSWVALFWYTTCDTALAFTTHV